MIILDIPVSILQEFLLWIKDISLEKGASQFIKFYINDEQNRKTYYRFAVEHKLGGWWIKSIEVS